MSRSVSAPSSVTKTSPCWNGLIVPGSTFRYGSNFWAWTLIPRAFRRRPSEAATMPLPRPETTPPVTKTYFVGPTLMKGDPSVAGTSRTCSVPARMSRAPAPEEDRTSGGGRLLEFRGRLAEIVEPVERAARELPPEADEPGRVDLELRSRPFRRTRQQPEIRPDTLGSQEEREPRPRLDRLDDEHSRLARTAEEARPHARLHAPAGPWSEAAP